VNKGFILTTDAVLAIIVAGLIAFSAMSLSTRFEDPLQNSRVLEEVGRDFLSTIEKDGTLADAVSSGSSEEITTALGELPPGACANLQVIENATVIMQVNRTGCQCSTELVILRRTFLVESGGAQREMFARFGGCLD